MNFGFSLKQNSQQSFENVPYIFWYLSYFFEKSSIISIDSYKIQISINSGSNDMALCPSVSNNKPRFNDLSTNIQEFQLINVWFTFILKFGICICTKNYLKIKCFINYYQYLFEWFGFLHSHMIGDMDTFLKGEKKRITNRI